MLRLSSAVLLLTLAACSFGPEDVGGEMQAPIDGRDDASLLDGAIARADGAPGEDAEPTAIDAPAQTIDGVPPGTVLAMLTIPVDGTIVTTSRTFAAGEPLRLRASGTFVIQSGAGTLADAEYWNWNIAAPEDLASPVDMGIAVDDLTPDYTKTPHFGAYSDSHVYEAPWTGTGGTLSARLFDGNYSNNTGSLTLEVLAP